MERLQIVIPEFEDWKRDMYDLQAKKNFHGTEFSTEKGHDTNAKFKTMEELLAESPIKLAPRR